MNYGGGMWEGGGRAVEWGGEWDNCNSIINKYIKKKKKKTDEQIPKEIIEANMNNLGMHV